MSHGIAADHPRGGDVTAAAELCSASGLTETATRRFVRNVGSNGAFAILNVVLMTWYIPFLVHHLGVDAYSVIALSNTLVLYAAIVSASLDTSVNRFLAIEVNRGSVDGANRVFNAALALSIGGCGALLVPAAVVTCLFPSLFKVPSGLADASRALFASAAFATLLAILSGNFGLAGVVTHRFDLRNLVRGAASIVRFGVVTALFAAYPATLYGVAAGLVLSACVGLAGDLWLCRRLMPQLRIDLRQVELGRLRAMMSLGGWSVVNQTGFMLLMQVDLILVNRFFGPEATGRYGSLMLFPALIYLLTEPVITVLSPIIMARYAVADYASMLRLINSSVKLIGLGLALPVGLLCGFGGPILALWLGLSFAPLDLLVVLLVGHLTIGLAVRPIAYLLTAYNRVRLQGIVTLALGVANIGLAIGLIRWTGLGMAAVAAASAITWLIRNLVFLNTYSAIVSGQRWWTFSPALLAGAACTVGVALAGRLIVRLWHPETWVALGAWAVGVAVSYAAILYLVGLDSRDRELLRTLLRRGQAFARGDAIVSG